MALIDEAQKLDQSGKIRLVYVDATQFGGGEYFYHYYAIPHTPAEIQAAGGDPDKLKPKSIMFAGEEFVFYPYGLQDMDISTEQAASPQITIANIDGVITALCLQFKNLLGAKVTIIDTYRKFLDGGPDANPAERREQVFYIDTKTYEDDEIVTFTLSSPADFQGMQLPKRQVTMICHWAMTGRYRSGDGCAYNGTAYFDAKGNPVSDPARDVCGGLMSDCQARFGAGLSNPNEAYLDFGGYPACDLVNAS